MKTKILLLVLVAFPFTLKARLAIESDFPFVISDSNTEIIVNDDGSYDTESSVSFKVIKEEAKAQLSLYKMQFDSSIEDMNVIEAYVQNGDDKILVNKANIQRSAIAATSRGIVNNTEIAIPFSQIKLDSIVNLKLKIKNKKGPFGKYFSENIYWGDQLPEKGSISISSSQPLFYKTNDPQKVLNITNEKEKDGKYWLRAKLANQFSYIAVQEMGIISKNENTSLSISNIEKWEDVRKILNSKYEPVLNEKMPNELTKVINAIPKNASFEQKISAVLEYITGNYDYLGDWRKKGKYIPKFASKITADRFGDCKDFSTLLIKMLRAINIQADYALVERSYEHPLMINEGLIPTLDYFNHMIVRVQNNEEVYWIDPTNDFSLGMENRIDISERNAFVLGMSPKVIQFIKKTNKDKKFYTTKKNYNFLNENEADVEGKLVIEGESSRMLQDSFKDKTENDYQEALKSIISQTEKTAFTELQNLNSRKISYNNVDVNFKYKVNKLNQKEERDDLKVLSLPSAYSVLAFRNSKVSDFGTVNIALVPSVVNETMYKNIFLSGKSPVGCDIKSDWVDATRKFELLPDGILVKDYINFKKDFLSRFEFQETGFSVIANDLISCFVGNTINYDFGTLKHVDRNSNFENSIANLAPALKLAKRRELAGNAIDNRSAAKTKDSLDLDDVKRLLETNLAENPNDSDSFRLMAAYYRSNALIIGQDFEINSMKRALEYADKAILADPNNKLALLEKITILMKLKMDSEANKLFFSNVVNFDRANLTFVESKKILQLIYAFGLRNMAPTYFEVALKASTTNKEKSSLYSMRAMNHLDFNNNQLCIDNYKWAIKLDNSQAWDHGNLSICYNSLGKYDEAIQSAKNAIKIKDYGAAHFYLATAYVGKAKLEIVKKNFKEAEVLLQQAVLEGPDADVYINLSYVYLLTGQEEKARAMANKCFEYEDNKYPAENIKTALINMFKSRGLEYK